MIQLEVSVPVAVNSSVDLYTEDVIEGVLEGDLCEMLGQVAAPPITKVSAFGEANEVINIITAHDTTVFRVVVYE